tara:strand:- start:1341 stop:2471 length:1131 start_codon:yes stop_codon:yes gene_type:complete
MSLKDIIDFSTFSDALAATELFSNSIRKGFEYDSYGGKTKFKAIVLTVPIPVSPEDIKYFLGDTKVEGGIQPDKVSKFTYRARIVGENSPHSFLPNPCSTEYASDALSALEITSMHTLFVSNSDGEAGDSFPRIGSTVEVELTKNAYSYNIQYGRHVSVVTNPDTPTSGSADCDSIKEAMDAAGGAFSLGSLSEPQVRTYRGVAGEQDLSNGQLPASVLKKSKHTGRFLVDVVDDFDRLVDAFIARFGKKIILTDHYRTYEVQVSLKRKKPKLAARPGTSNHGWGLAFDFNHIDSEYGISGGKQGFESTVYKWLKANAPTYNFHNPSWAVEGGSNPEPWHFESTKKSSIYSEPKKNAVIAKGAKDGEADPTDTTRT